MTDDITRLVTQWRHNAQGCGKRDAHAAGTWRSCARELEAALALQQGKAGDHIEDKLVMVAAHSPDAGVTAEQVCSYPRCNCPFDAPGDPNWCARGFPTTAPQPKDAT